MIDVHSGNTTCGQVLFIGHSSVKILDNFFSFLYMLKSRLSRLKDTLQDLGVEIFAMFQNIAPKHSKEKKRKKLDRHVLKCMRSA